MDKPINLGNARILRDSIISTPPLWGEIYHVFLGGESDHFCTLYQNYQDILAWSDTAPLLGNARILRVFGASAPP